MKRKSKHQRDQERWAKQYGSEAYIRYIKTLPCCGCGRQSDIEASHVRSRGAGGKWYHIVPKCYDCHQRVWHGLNAGRDTFCTRFGWTIQGLMDYAQELADKGRDLVEPDAT